MCPAVCWNGLPTAINLMRWLNPGPSAIGGPDSAALPYLINGDVSAEHRDVAFLIELVPCAAVLILRAS